MKSKLNTITEVLFYLSLALMLTGFLVQDKELAGYVILGSMLLMLVWSVLSHINVRRMRKELEAMAERVGLGFNPPFRDNPELDDKPTINIDFKGMPKFTIVQTDKEQSITCSTCLMTSYNLNDISNRYCGKCNKFHDDY